MVRKRYFTSRKNINNGWVIIPRMRINGFSLVDLSNNCTDSAKKRQASHILHSVREKKKDLLFPASFARKSEMGAGEDFK